MKNELSKNWLDEKFLNIGNETKNMVNPILASQILSSVKRIVNIVHNDNKYEVIFNNNEQSGYIDYRKKQIVISSALMRKLNQYSIYDIIDFETGLALHESAHAEHTFSKYVMDAKREFNNIESNIFNIIEDAIIEKIVANDFPGYEQYFLKLRKYYFKDNSVKSTNNKLADRINELLIGLRYPGNAIIKNDISKKAIKIVNDVITNDNDKLKKVDRIELTKQVYSILISELENDKKENNDSKNNPNNNSNNTSSNSSSNNSSDNSTNIDSNNKIDLSNIQIGGALKDFLNKEREHKDDKLSNIEEALLKSIIEENYVDNDMEKFGSKFNVITCTPKITDVDKKLYDRSKKNINKYISRFRNNFSDANTIYRQNAYGLQSGNLDEDSLYSAKFNRNIFMNNIVTNMQRTKNVDIAFVNDNSGSMSSQLSYQDNTSRLTAARELCILFIEALEPIKNINTWVFAFQSASNYLKETSNGAFESLSYDEKRRLQKVTQLIELYSPKQKNKYGIATMKAGGLTPEFEGLSKAKDILLKEGKPGNKKVIIMLTDGDPYSERFGSSEQVRLLKKEMEECKKKGITLIHLALTPEAEYTPYKNKIKWDNKGHDSLVTSFLKMLKKEIA